MVRGLLRQTVLGPEGNPLGTLIFREVMMPCSGETLRAGGGDL